MLRVFLSLLIVLFIVAGAKPAVAADLLSSVALPQQLFDEMVEAGIGEWRTLAPVAGTKLTIGRPVMCEACGTPFFSQPNAANNTCPNCPHPVTANSRRFVTPKQILADGSLRIFTPVATAKGALSPQAKAAYAAIAELIPELQPCSCGRLNNPTLPNNSCWGCGTAIDKTKIRPAQQVTTPITGNDHMPTQQTVQDTIRQTRTRTMRGAVTTAPAVVAPPRATRRINPRVVKIAAIGGVSTVAVAGIALGIGYVMTGDDVHISRGRVEVISPEEVIIHVPGFAQPLVLKYDSDTQYDNDIYTKTTLDVYQNVDMVDVWWSRDDGVIQILPIDLFSISGDANE